MALIVRHAEVGGRRADVRCANGRVTAIGDRVDHASDDDVIDARGGALIPGLHDHHAHLLSLAAALESVRCGPPEVTNEAALVAALRGASAVDWIRGVDYHESVAGMPDRDTLDRWCPESRLRMQHRSGALWMLNSAALHELDIEHSPDPRVERDGHGRATGRLWRADELVRPASSTPSLTRVGARLAAEGVTSVTDATATNDATSAALLGQLPQRVRVMGPLGLATEGEVKLLLDDDALPPLDDAVILVRDAHAQGRGVAVHCVTLVQLVFAIEMFRRSGVEGDRIEHASVAPGFTIAAMVELGLRVVSQPGFVAERGDAYLRDVEPVDRDALYAFRSMLAAGLSVRGSTDAPFGRADCWGAMRAAVDRRTAGGAVLGPEERLSPEQALDLFSTSPAIRPGGRADLVVLTVPFRAALLELDARNVVATVVAGRVVFRSGGRPD
ncbi:MAG: hypothetical protein QOI44_716 [Actinomycetota bacterium]|nr:hypothetical protein [Actinomycetota bacterium]